MSESSRKERIVADLQQAKQKGELTAEKIKEIVQNAISQGLGEAKESKTEITTYVQDAIAAVIEIGKEKGSEFKEEITASLEGAIAAISSSKRKEISQDREQIQDLQTKVDSEEQQLQQQINSVLQDVRQKGLEQSIKVKEAIELALDNFKETEEAALLQKRYAQLKAQLAILQANLASRYPERYDEVTQYLNEAKKWYNQAKEDPETFTEQVAQKRAEFETKLGETGSAIAKKEKQLKQLLQELWLSIKEAFK
jgi:transcriptional regulator NrdR family protein